MLVTFIRHAQSRFNAGWGAEIDSRLSPAGITQAMSLTGNYDIVLLSPLKRAIETYLHSSIHSTEIFITDFARENINTVADIRMGETLKQTTEHEAILKCSNLVKMLKLIHIEKGYKNIAVITHYGLFATLSRIVLDHQVELDNAKSFTIEFTV